MAEKHKTMNFRSAILTSLSISQLRNKKYALDIRILEKKRCVKTDSVMSIQLKENEKDEKIDLYNRSPGRVISTINLFFSAM